MMELECLEIGKAAEHFVVCDLILGGYRAFLSDQGLPYDIVMENDRKFYRIQVKATLAPRNVAMKGRGERIMYNWCPYRRGKDGKKRIDRSTCDIVALVALDIKKVLYLKVEDVPSTFQMHPENSVPDGHYKRVKSALISTYTIEKAIADE